MQVRQFPPIGGCFRPCAYADIEIRTNFADFGQDDLVEFLFGNRPFASPISSLGNLFMLVVQAKRHCSENDIKTLQQNMIVGVNFSNVLSLDVNGLPFLGFGQSKQKAFELLALFCGVGESIEIQAQTDILWNMLQTKAMFDELVIQQIIFPIHLLSTQSARQVGVLAKHYSDAQIAASNFLKEDADQFFIFWQIEFCNFFLLYFLIQVEIGLCAVQTVGNSLKL